MAGATSFETHSAHSLAHALTYPNTQEETKMAQCAPPESVSLATPMKAVATQEQMARTALVLQ